MRKYPNNISIFVKAFSNTKHEMWISLQILCIIAIVLSCLMFLAESASNTEYTFMDALTWAFVKFVDDPADIAEPPISTFGQIVGTLIGVVGVAIFAVPAGLIGSGFMDAMSETRRTQELAVIRKRLQKKFRRAANKALREYLNTLPNKGGDQLKVLNFVPRNKSLSTLQIQIGVSIQDLFDAAKAFPEFRIHNLASSKSKEEDATDHFVMEHFPVNRSYGCCINRKSKITIISTSSYNENCIGWWSYYLAMLGGFNYISKDLEVDMDDTDSFFNISDEPTFEDKKKMEYSSKEEGYIVIGQKEARRKEFFDDIHSLTQNKDNNWIFTICESIKNSSNTADMHLSVNNRKEDNSTVIDLEAYSKMASAISTIFNELEMVCISKSDKYPLLKKNILYRLKEKEGICCNGVSLLPSSDLVCFDNRSLLIAFKISQAINESLNRKCEMLQEDLTELKSGFGFRSQSIK